MSAANGKSPTAAQRAHRLAQDAQKAADAAENSLAQVIGQAVALHLAQVLPQIMAQMPWQPACVLCVSEHKNAEAGYLAKLGDTPVEDRPPFEGPPIAQAITLAPFVTSAQSPPVAAPLCYRHLASGPTVRPTGLVDAAGRPMIATR